MRRPRRTASSSFAEHKGLGESHENEAHCHGRGQPVRERVPHWLPTTTSSLGRVGHRSAVAAPTPTASSATARTARRRRRWRRSPGPKDGAKAQEYQNIDSGVDRRHRRPRRQPRVLLLRCFGEELGRDDQYILTRGGGYDVFKAALYSDRMPHNLSWNALTPLHERRHRLPVRAGRRLSAGDQPGDVEHVRLRPAAQHRRRQHRSQREVAVLRPRRLQRGGRRPACGRRAASSAPAPATA